jgi:hypothetical protein
LAERGTEPEIQGCRCGGVRHKRRELDHKKGSNLVNLRLKYGPSTQYRQVRRTVRTSSRLGV